MFFCFSLDYFVLVLFAYVVLGLVSFLQEKNISKVTYFVSNGTQKLNPINTVNHFLVECTNLQDIREKYFTVGFVNDLSESVNNHTVTNFVKVTDFYHQL